MKISILLKKTEILVLIGRFKEAEELSKTLLEESEKIGDQKFVCLSLKHLSHIDFYKGNLDEAFTKFQQRLTIAEEISDKKEIMASIGNLGAYYGIKNNFDKALEYSEKCLKLAKEMNDKLQYVKSLINIGSVYSDLYQSDKAISYFKEAMKFAEEFSFKKEQIAITKNLGVAFRDKKDFAQAEEYFQKSLQAAEEIMDKQQMANVLGLLAEITRFNNYQDAINYYQRALDVKKEIGNLKGAAISSWNIGKLYFELEEYDQAKEYYNNAIEFGTKWKFNLCVYLYSKAELLFRLQNYTKAEELNNEAQKIAKNVKRENIVFLTKLLSIKLNTLQKSVEQQVSELLKIEPEDEREKAVLNYELWNILRISEIPKMDDMEKYRKNALDYYKKQYDDTSRFEFWEKIKKLKQWKR